VLAPVSSSTSSSCVFAERGLCKQRSHILTLPCTFVVSFSFKFRLQRNDDRYQPGQYYQVHNDYIPYQLDRPCGVRVLTFYFYLSDVDEGGGTNFPHPGDAAGGGLTVEPKLGRAVLWPSVLNADPTAKDSRSDHQALPVVRGTKDGANAWIHAGDFKTANTRSCT
jgi:prolyl 4-hydroxylase